MADYAEIVAQDARLTILKELAKQTDWRLNQTILLSVLDAFGHNKSKEWLRTQLNVMADLGAISVIETGSVMIAELKQAGLDHVERRGVIDGIKRPSPEA